MSFYRALIAAVAAMVIALPVFAEDVAPATDTSAETATTQQTTTTTTSEEQTKVNLNKATVKELVKVKGLEKYPAKAKAIVAYRKKHGDFKSTDDLAKVKGFTKMKPETLKAITDQLTVD
jgi:competence protein ComEA